MYQGALFVFSDGNLAGQTSADTCVERKMLHRIFGFALVFQLGLCIGLPQCQTNAELISVTVPFASPQGEYVTQRDRYHSFRIPGMVVAPDGSVLLFAEARRGSGKDPRTEKDAPIDIVMRRSTDNGRTWQPLVVIESGFRPDGHLVDFGDPTPVLDSANGTVFLLYGQWADKGARYPAHGQSVNTDDAHQVLWVRSSGDNGTTWTDRRQIVYPDEPNETSDKLYWRYAEPGPGNGIQLKWQDRKSVNGRLVVPAKRAGSKTPEGEVTTEPFVFFSDDHGEIWHVGNVTAGPDANESEVVELTDGKLLLDGRQNSGEHRRRHVSSDGGMTWGPDRPFAIPVTKVDGSLSRYSAKRAGHDCDRILFSAPRGEPGLSRGSITVWTSYDEGRTFMNPVQFNRGFAAYSVIQRLQDGTIGFAVETAVGDAERYGGIRFFRFNLAELESKAP